jgi:hypothetical protein
MKFLQLIHGTKITSLPHILKGGVLNCAYKDKQKNLDENLVLGHYQGVKRYKFLFPKFPLKEIEKPSILSPCLNTNCKEN